VWRVKDSNLGRHQPTDLQPERTVPLTWGKALGVCSVGTHSAQRSETSPTHSEDVLGKGQAALVTALDLPAERVGAGQRADASLVDLAWAHLAITPGWVAACARPAQNLTEVWLRPTPPRKGPVAPTQLGNGAVAHLRRLREERCRLYGPVIEALPFVTCEGQGAVDCIVRDNDW
jgi:hypothetical protein